MIAVLDAIRGHADERVPCAGASVRGGASRRFDIDDVWHSDAMPSESRHISEWIDRPASEVYEYAADPVNLPRWAPGLGSAVENIDGRWFVESPMGRVGLAFVQRNDFGILDHHVTLPSGEVVYNPMRVIPDGDACEVVFTVRRRPGVSDEDFGRDEGAVAADLALLKRVLEDR
jgi:hypothetical protein